MLININWSYLILAYKFCSSGTYEKELTVFYKEKICTPTPLLHQSYIGNINIFKESIFWVYHPFNKYTWQDFLFSMTTEKIALSTKNKCIDIIIIVIIIFPGLKYS